MTQSTTQHDDAPRADIRAVEQALQRLGWRARLILLTQRVARIAALAIAAVVALAAMDYVIRMPVGMRMFHFVAGVAIVLWAAVTFVAPAWRLRPSFATLALRVEKQRPELEGVLASGVEFGTQPRSKAQTEFERTLAQRVVSAAARTFSPDDLKGVLKLDQLVRAVAVLLIASLGTAAIWIAAPELASIGARRTLAPWADAPWPKRTAVVDLTMVDVHPLGAALPLQAALTRSNREPAHTDVAVEYRAVRSGGVGPIRRELLTWQQREVETPSGRAGELFERLIETNAETLEYRFVTADDQTAWRRVRLVAPPAVASAQATITPPPYATALRIGSATSPLIEATTIDLGDGTDERAVAPPALAGSRIELSITFNKAIPALADEVQSIAHTLGADLAATDATLEATDLVWTLAWTLEESVRMPLALTDEHGIESTAESVFRFECVQDRPATATVTEPASDMTALATAVVRTVGEGRDDVGLSAVWLERQHVRPAGAATGSPSGPGGAVEPVADPVEIARVERPGELTITVETTLDLAPLGLRAGDQVWLTAVANDVFTLAGAGHEPTRSVTRIVRIIDESDFIREIQSELSSLRQGAIRLHDDQQKLRDLGERERAGVEARRGQAQLTERIARLGEQLRRVEQRVNDNALNDRQLENVLNDAERFLQESGQWSAEASDRLEQAEQRRRQEENPDRPLNADEEQRLDDAQQRVQDELAGLAELLDRGEDAWVARRQLQDLLNQQQELRERTERAGRNTAGRSTSQLTTQERSELEQIVEKQLELAQTAQELAEELEDRARDLEEHDPAAAAGMRQAARRAQQSQVAQKMQQAAQQAGENQMAQAGEQQEQAAEDLQEMLEDMDDAERSREEVLRRVLASLIESLEALITLQRTEINALAAAAERDRFDGLDQGMIRLNQNTLGVLDQASGAGREVAPVADLIGRAIESQTQAIMTLRSEPIDAPQADMQERRSLEFLQQARDEAEKIDQEMQRRQQDRARDELRQAYREALERQVALRAETEEFAPLEDLDRRQRASLRRLGQQQKEIQAALQGLLEKSEGLADAAVFEYAHRRMDSAAETSSSALSEERAADSLPSQTMIIALLQGMVEAMKQPPQREQEFASGGGAGSGGGSGGGDQLIPPIAELRLLRQIQIDLALRTRIAADGHADATTVRSLGEEQAELGELGEDLVRRMQQEQQNGGAPVETPE